MTDARRRGRLPFTLGDIAPSERHTECAAGVGVVVRVGLLLAKEGKGTVLTNVDTCPCKTAPGVGGESMQATNGRQKFEPNKISCKRGAIKYARTEEPIARCKALFRPQATTH